jgi:hypothetical protein
VKIDEILKLIFMNRIIILVAITLTVISCEKSPVEQTNPVVATVENNGSPAQKSLIDIPLQGSWRLIEYYEDNGTGSGRWVAPDFKEMIRFDKNGEFGFAETFPLYSYGYQTYITENDGFVMFFPGVLNAKGMGDTYQYMLESPDRLVFFPICKENCMRRYELIETVDE